MNAESYVGDCVSLVEQYRKSVREDFTAIPESLIWDRPVHGQVSAANMVLHLTGNLRHFFGHLLGGSDYVRERDKEFQDDVRPSKAEILAGWETACEETVGALRRLDDVRLSAPAPWERFPGGGATHTMIQNLLGHLTYHAGQIRSLYRIQVKPD